MDKHLLLAVSGEQSYNLRFIRNFFRDFCSLRLTLLYVAQLSGRYPADPVANPEQAGLFELNAMAQSHGHRYLESAARWIIDHACAPERVTRKILPSRTGTVEEIVAEAQAGLYDAVVLGRRGLSWLEELVEDSVSHRILWQNIDFPVWIVASDIEADRKDVLLCVDGSAPSVRIADHVGFMLAAEPGHRVTLFYVKTDTARTDSADEARLEQATTALLDNNFPEERIDIKVVQALSPTEAILAEAEAGRYAVVAAGRSSGEPTGLKRMKNRSVSTQLLYRLSKFALWISR